MAGRSQRKEGKAMGRKGSIDLAWELGELGLHGRMTRRRLLRQMMATGGIAALGAPAATLLTAFNDEKSGFAAAPANSAAENQRFSGVAFDAFGTLFDIQALRPKTRSVIPSRADEVFDQFLARLVPWTWFATVADRFEPFPEIAKKAFIAAGQQLGVAVSQEDAAEIVSAMDSLPIFPGTVEALGRLSRDIPLAILSNGTTPGITALAKNNGIDQFFDHLLAVDQVDRFKPAGEVYALATKAFDASGERVVLVSGNDFDVTGAKLAGLSAVWFSRGRNAAPLLGVAADIVVKDITELPEAILSS